ncbi:MAG TPA: sigma 54-interacting transcriptional regulator [Blastocatellia bacterium]|nr:sigma 54-interacting transcriptional regulator [Blastocatellia bacterium]
MVWTTENGLPQNSINAIVQTHDGYLWLATQGGVVRFDGMTFTVFDSANTPVLKSNRILCLYEGRAGDLWIGTQLGGLIRYTRGKFSAYTTRDGLPSDEISSLYEDRQGVLWIGTTRGLAAWREGRFTTYSTRDGLPHEHVKAIAEDRAGNLWIGTYSGLARFRQGTFTVYTMADGLSASRIFAIQPDRDGNLWVSTGNGLVQVTEGRIIAGPLAQYNSRLGRVNGVVQDRDGALWIATATGLFHFRSGQLSQYTKHSGLSDDNITAVLMDREANLWIGTWVGGLNYLRESHITTIPQGDDSSLDAVRPIYQDAEGDVWFGSMQQGLNRLHRGAIITYTANEGLPPAQISSLVGDREGNLWVGTWGGGLAKLKPRSKGHTGAVRGLSVSVYTAATSGLPGDHVNALYVDRQGALWIGISNGLARFHNNEWTTFRPSDGLVHHDVRFITEDRHGALWIGTTNGLSRFKDGRFTNYTTADGLSHNYVREVYEDEDGVLWIGTYGGGLNRLHDGRFTQYTKKEGLFDIVVSRILEDDQGNLWMSGNRGIFRVSRRELNDFAQRKIRSITCLSYGIADGMKSSECNGGFQPAGWKTRDGRLWFPTFKGVVVIDPRRISTLAPPVAIEKIISDQNLIDVQNAVTLPPGRGDLEIHFTAISFIVPEKVRFRYRLEGYDREWVDAGTRRVAYYTNLPPGDYRFRVIASNRDGVWNETGATFAVSLRPHFYQTLWFYALMMLALMGSGWGVNRLRMRRLLRRTRELEAAVASRTAEVVRQKDQLAETNAQLAQANELLGRANENMLAVLNEFQAAVVMTDAAGRVTFLSQMAELLFNQSGDDALGHPWTDVLPLPDADKARLKELCEMTPGRRSKLPVNMQVEGGRRYWMEVEVKDDPRSSESRIFFFYDASEIYSLRSLLDERARFHGLVGASSAMQLIYKQIRDVAKMELTVLIEGETGTGKELVARAIHLASHRRDKPFIAVNCAGLTESLLTSQLFGHRRGAFTGATADHIGLIEAAHGGTLFLDEIGDIPLSVQASLLRVLQEKEITRLGESVPRKVDVRILAATNRDLNQAVVDGTFRQDLLYRIRVGRIQLPPLRQRMEDLPLLVAWFLGQLRASAAISVQDVSREAMDLLMEYSWPGNVRELKNAIEYAAAHCRGSVIQIKDLPKEIVGQPGPIPSTNDRQDERQRILDALAQAEGNRARAARRLGIGRTTLYRRMKALGIEID